MSPAEGANQEKHTRRYKPDVESGDREHVTDASTTELIPNDLRDLPLVAKEHTLKQRRRRTGQVSAYRLSNVFPQSGHGFLNHGGISFQDLEIDR